MNGPATPAHRVSARTTALTTLAIFIPLFGLLLWWAFEYRVVPVAAGAVPRIGTLPPVVGVFATLFAAAWPALLVALLLANRARLRAVFRPSRRRIVGALVLSFLTPWAVISWVPWIIGGFGVLVLLEIPGASAFDPQSLLSIGAYLGALALAALVWYPAACLLVSGIRSHWLQVAGFALTFWAAYALHLLVSGYQVLAP